MNKTFYLPFASELQDRVRYLSACDPCRAHRKGEFRFVVDRGLEILAAAPGRVVSVNDSRSLVGMASYGSIMPVANRVVVDHIGVFAEYHHVFPVVAEGEEVRTGTILGEVGGYLATHEPHFHLRFFRRVWGVPFRVGIKELEPQPRSARILLFDAGRLRASP